MLGNVQRAHDEFACAFRFQPQSVVCRAALNNVKREIQMLDEEQLETRGVRSSVEGANLVKRTWCEHHPHPHPNATIHPTRASTVPCARGGGGGVGVGEPTGYILGLGLCSCLLPLSTHTPLPTLALTSHN
jgi:hypothetical protein